MVLKTGKIFLNAKNTHHVYKDSFALAIVELLE